jgi:hypothetical protein
MTEKCFACGKPLPKSKKMADTRDDQIVWVGPDCYRKIVAAGESGYQPTQYLRQGKLVPAQGPRLYPTKRISDAEVDAYIKKLAAADLAAGIE